MSVRPGGPCSLRRSLTPNLDAATAARRALAGLDSQIDDDLLTRSRLAVSEVVTNSVKHAQLRPREAIDLEVWVLPDRLHVEVTDRGPGFKNRVARPDPDGAAAGGWGLWLVDQLADGWGVDLSHSTRVWMEFDRLDR
jgi:anti-sigma regulatory factor (Ser/Thr protein kinase)